ncbi:hypothetical protein BH11ACT3_BH11ACT3_01640 [soil metagenome]
MRMLRDLPVLDPVSTWLSLGRTLPPHDLTAVGDFLITERRGKKPLASLEQLHDALANSRRFQGAPRLRLAVIDVRSGAWSRTETHVRLLLTSVGIPEPQLNVSLVDADGRELIPDLAWPEYRIALEYNGWHHETSRNRIADVRRLDRYADIGWSAMAVDRTELYRFPSHLVSRVIRRLDAAGWSGGRLIQWPLSASFEP